jgi:predicted nucleotidyltransferase
LQHSAIGGESWNLGYSVLVTFDPDSQASIFDMSQMQIELEELFGHHVDILEKEGLRNPFRRREILKTVKMIFED